MGFFFFLWLGLSVLIPSLLLPKLLTPDTHAFPLLTSMSSFVGLQGFLSWKNPVADIAAYSAGRVLSFTDQVTDGVSSRPATPYPILHRNNQELTSRPSPPLRRSQNPRPPLQRLFSAAVRPRTSAVAAPAAKQRKASPPLSRSYRQAAAGRCRRADRPLAPPAL